MFRQDKKHRAVPILSYWTRRYVLVLLLCLFLIAVAIGVWIRSITYDRQYELLESRAEQLAEVYGQLLEDNTSEERFRLNRAVRNSPFLIQTADESDRLETVKLFKNSFPAEFSSLSPRHQEVLSGKDMRERVKADSQTWLRVGVPIFHRGSVVKALYVSLPAFDLLRQLGNLYASLAVLIATVGLAGWLVLYFLSRKLTRPLLQIADAARDIARGNYDPDLPRQVKELELQQLVSSFQNMAAQLKQMERLRSDLLAGVSHELRTPVTSLRGMIQAVRDGVVTGGEAQDFLRISLDEAKRLQSMVEDLLDMSTLESGAAAVERQPFNLSVLVEEALKQVSAMPGFAGVEFIRQLPDQPVWIEADPGRLRQILLNLFSNSIKASADQIRVILNDGGEQVTVEVIDNGKGIDETDRPYVFERFYRGHVVTGRARGLGLGLTISRLLARAHGGDLTLGRNPAGGATFILTIPVTTQ